MVSGTASSVAMDGSAEVSGSAPSVAMDGRHAQSDVRHTICGLVVSGWSVYLAAQLPASAA